MELTYTWQINRLKKQNSPSLQLNDIVIQTYWEYTGTNEDGLTGTFHGATPFSLDQVDPDNFTTYENLTKEQIIGWIQNTIDSNLSYKAHIDAHINEQIQRKIDANTNNVTDVNSDNFPWSM